MLYMFIKRQASWIFGSAEGYRCYHPPSRKFFVSANVVFNETEYYYVPEVVPESGHGETEPTELEFLRYEGFIPSVRQGTPLEDEPESNSATTPAESDQRQVVTKEEEDPEEDPEPETDNAELEELEDTNNRHSRT